MILSESLAQGFQNSETIPAFFKGQPRPGSCLSEIKVVKAQTSKAMYDKRCCKDESLISLSKK